MPETQFHPVARTALAHLARVAQAKRGPANQDGPRPAVTLSERPIRGQFTLRGDGEDPAFLQAVQETVGVAVPVKPNTVCTSPDGAVHLLWLGPDEWLLVTSDAFAAAFSERLRTALSGLHAALVDVSDGRTVIVLAGDKARDVLAKGCPLDLHPRVFGPGHCAQSHLAKAHVILHQLDETPTFDIYVHRSFAGYLWTWLEDAADEYGYAITTV